MIRPRGVGPSTAGAFALIALLASPAAARPGGGQSFGGSSRSSSSSPSRSSGGSSWGGSSSPSHSWGGSSSPSRSSWGGSSRSDSPSSSPGTSYTPRSDPALDRQIRVIECQQHCIIGAGTTASDDWEKCRAECERNPPAPPPPSYESYSSPSDHSMAKVFVGPVIAACIIGAGLAVLAVFRRRRDAEWASSGFSDFEATSPSPKEELAGEKYPSIEAAIASLRGKDEAFSWVLFEDFVYALYTEAHTLRSTGQVARLAPYFSRDALDVLEQLGSGAVKGIIVGSARVEEVRVDDLERKVTAAIAFESNYTEGERSYYVRERWVLSRSADAPSRPLDRSRTIDCPSCGAPLDKTVAGKCSYCNAVSGEGSLDWRVERIEGVEREVRGPILIGTTEEVGTDLPTVVAPDVKERWAALSAKDPAVTWSALVARIEATFKAFHASWSAQELSGVRAFLSDNLFETQKYWVAAYKGEGLRNITDNPTIATIHLSRVTSDALFDLVTVRVYASCCDYTLNASGKVVGGSQTKERSYSEYWTFIRGAGVRGAPRAEAVCPHCGADSAQINMAGSCDHCQKKITNGSFDWVLSRIEQDEVFDIS